MSQRDRVDLDHGARHVSCLIPDPLQIGHRLDHREDQPQVARGRLPARQDALALAIELDLHRVDLDVAPQHACRHIGIAALQRADHVVELRQHQPRHVEHAAVQLLQILVVLLHEVVSEVFPLEGHASSTISRNGR